MSMVLDRGLSCQYRSRVCELCIVRQTEICDKRAFSKEVSSGNIDVKFKRLCLRGFISPMDPPGHVIAGWYRD